MHLPRAEDRVLLVLSHLADTWGRVTAQGTLLPIRLPHDVIGQLVGARRSTVTLALGSLEQCIRRTEDGSWLLTPAAEARVRLITAAGRREELLGASVLLRELLSETRDEARALRGESGQIRARRRATAQQVASS